VLCLDLKAVSEGLLSDIVPGNEFRRNRHKIIHVY